MSARLVVLKVGGSVLRTDDDLATAVHGIYAEVRRGRRVIAVVSAIGCATEALLARAARLAAPERDDGVAALLATGERVAAALLVMALDRAGVPSSLVDPVEAALTADGPRREATPRTVDVMRLRDALRRRAVVVVPGFFAAHADGGLALLGRGGSDLTALFLAHRLGCRCRLLKDVDGVYDADPAGHPTAQAYARLSFADATALAARVVQGRALTFASRHALPFQVGSWWREEGTWVGADATRRPRPTPPEAPLRVVLLGLGTVGRRVHGHLVAQPALFTIVGIAVRDVSRRIAEGLPASLLDSDARRLVEREADVVVELMGGTEPAADVMRLALAAGRHVVTANKAVIAECGPALARLAAERGVTLRHSAAVGGAVPVVETVRRVARGARIARVDAVLNGTTNFVLDRMAEGTTLETAVRAARQRGFAEADPALDLDGSDAAQKLAIVARAAFGCDPDWRAIDRLGIDGALPRPEAGHVVRLVATAVRAPAGDVRLSVRPRCVPSGHPLGDVREEENAAVIRTAAGRRIVVSGRGAGSWPTAESVMADLVDLVRRRAGSPDRRPPAAEGAIPC